MRTQFSYTRWIFPNVAPRSGEHAQKPFIGFVINGNANVGTLAGVYGLKVAASHHVKTVADYLIENLYGYPLTGDRVPFGNIELVVLKKNGRALEKVGLDFRRPAVAGEAGSRGNKCREKPRHSRGN